MLQNLLGVAVLCAVEMAVAPRLVAAELRASLARALREASAAAEAAWGSHVEGAGASGTAAAAAAVAAEAARAHVAALGAQLARQRTLLTEAGEEAAWAPLSPVARAAPLPVRAVQAAIDCGARLAVLLSLMQGMEWEREEGEEEEVGPEHGEAGNGTISVVVGGGRRTRGADEDAGRLIGPCLPQVRELLDVLRRRYATLGLYIAGDAGAAVGPAASATAAAGASSAELDAAVRHLEARVSSIFALLIREGGGGGGGGGRRQGPAMVSTREMVRFVSLAWATSELARNCEALREAIRGLERPWRSRPASRIPGIADASLLGAADDDES